MTKYQQKTVLKLNINRWLQVLLISGIVFSFRPLRAESPSVELPSVDQCKEALNTRSVQIKSLDKAFKKMFFNKDIYCPGYCYANVVRVFNEFKVQEPDITESQFKVIYIATPIWAQQLRPLKKFLVKKARTAYKDKKREAYMGFDFHVVLNFRGRIYDLDYTRKPHPIGVKAYFKKFFVAERDESAGFMIEPIDNLLVYEIPGEEYLTLDPEEAGYESFHRKIFSDYKGVKLVDYVKALHKKKATSSMAL